MDIQNADYIHFLDSLKQKVRLAQTKASLSVNREMILLYWEMGRDIIGRQEALGWGAKVIQQLSHDLRREFPDVQGFSPRNLKFMRSLAEAYSEEELVKQAVSLIPWGHNIRIIQKVKEPHLREWYIKKTIENGWSRSVLVHQIESELHQRLGTATSNFASTLPQPQSELVQEITKDPYVFDFLTLSNEANERDIEKALLEHIREFLLELGVGFAFVGSQVHLEVGGDDFYIDLLFYHLKLRCYVVIDLKVKKFTPGDVGQLNFYLSVVDDQRRHPDDQPSIGIIICKDKNAAVVEYALRDIDKPVGVSGYEMTKAIPEDLKGSLPTIEALEAELEDFGDG